MVTESENKLAKIVISYLLVRRGIIAQERLAIDGHLKELSRLYGLEIGLE